MSRRPEGFRESRVKGVRVLPRTRSRENPKNDSRSWPDPSNTQKVEKLSPGVQDKETYGRCLSEILPRRVTWALPET